jgi:hypothetical protein
MHVITVVVDLASLGPNGRARIESGFLPLEVTKVMY